MDKHYKLEQELAFYKIDARFDQLGQKPRADPQVNSMVNDYKSLSQY